MKYQKYRPHGSLAPFVECYFTWDSEGDYIQALQANFIPSGLCSIVLNQGDLYTCCNNLKGSFVTQRHFFAGQTLYDFTLSFHGVISLAGIILKPTALKSLFNLPAFPYTEKRVSLRHVFCKRWVSLLAADLQAAEDNSEKVQLLEDFLMTQYLRQKPVLDSIDYAANLILERHGLVDIKEIIPADAKGSAAFKDQFFYCVGLMPEEYARLCRLSFIKRLVAARKKADWQTILQQCIEYDPQQFPIDFLNITGCSPQQYALDHRIPHLVRSL